MMTARRHRLGFTIIEMMVSIAITAIAIGAATTALMSQYSAMQGSDLSQIANTSGRVAMQQLERTLRRLGWGIEPRYAIDVTYCPNSPCRDNYNAPDELAFVTRNPMYQWTDYNGTSCTTNGGCFSGNAWAITSVNTAVTPHTVTLTLPANTYLEYGRIVLALCSNGQYPVMLRLSTRYGSSSGGSFTLVPMTEVANDPYNKPSSLQSCHGTTGAGLFLVDRYRYFIQTINGTPWLMLDTGLDTDNDSSLPPTDQDDLIPVAKNVEDMQVAYALNSSTTFTAPDSNSDWIVGNDSSSASSEQLTYSTNPDYTTPSTDAERFKKYPGNVRAIRVTLILRSDRRDLTRGAGWTGDSIPYAENRGGSSASGGNYRRYTAETEITLRNLDSTLSFMF